VAKQIIIFPAAVLITLLFCFTPFKRPNGEISPAISMQEPIVVKSFKAEEKRKRKIPDKKEPPKIERISHLKAATPRDPELVLDMSVPMVEIDFSPEAVSNLKIPDQDYSSIERLGNGENMEGVFNASEVDVPPQIKKYIQPAYPPKAKGQRIEGTVNIRAVILPNGLPQSVTVLSADPEGYFESAAINAVRSWSFYPAVEKGKKVKVLVEIPIEFNLNN
jgi:protein TonB